MYMVTTAANTSHRVWVKEALNASAAAGRPIVAQDEDFFIRHSVYFVVLGALHQGLQGFCHLPLQRQLARHHHPE